MGVEHGKASKTVAAAVLTDRRGSVATIVAVALVPIIIAAGVGLDFARASSARANLQDAIDATGLALAHLPANTPQATLDTKAQGWMNANLNAQLMGPVTLTVTPTQGQVYLSATSAVPTTLTAIAGFKSLPISAKSTVKWGLGHVEVALVLDNTGSMGQNNKLALLQVAAADLVDTLFAQVQSTDPNSLKMSVVPFAATVKIGAGYQGQSWLKGVQPAAYGADLFNGAIGIDRFDLLDGIGQDWGGCIEARPAPFDVQDTAPSSATPKSLFVPFFAPDEPDDGKVASGKNKGKTIYYKDSNDYLGDDTNPDAFDADAWWIRQGNNQKYDTAINSGGSPNAGCDVQSLVRLTTTKTTVKNKIAAMTANGNTNIPIGLAWGWLTLSPDAPFSDGASYTDANTKKFVVLLTDGDNTNDVQNNPNKSTYSALGYMWQERLRNKTDSGFLNEDSSASERSEAMDARMVLACTNMKAKGITIYTVRIDVSGSASTALRDCASSTDKYFDIDSSGLSAAFQNIAGSIGQLRIAQ